MKFESRVYQHKDGKAWHDVIRNNDESFVAAMLAEDLSGKYVRKGKWVTRVVRKQYYSHQEYHVYYGKDNRAVYTVQNG